MNYTKNLGLRMPEQDEMYNVDDFNLNAQDIDDRMNWRIYTSLEELGITPGTETIETIVEAMENKSKAFLVYQVGISNPKISPAPESTGEIEIVMQQHPLDANPTATLTYRMITSQGVLPRMWVGTYYASEGNVWAGWREVVTAAEVLTLAKTIWVSETGNDASGDGSEASPFLTIFAALVCAKGVYNNNAGITINFKPGTYVVDRIVGVFNFPSAITFQNPDAGQGTVTIRLVGNGYFNVTNCPFVGFSGLTIDGTQAAATVDCIYANVGTVLVANCVFVGAGARSCVSASRSRADVRNTTMTNVKTGMMVTAASIGAIASCSGSGVAVYVRAEDAIVTVGGARPAYTTYKTEVGGGWVNPAT